MNNQDNQNKLKPVLDLLAKFNFKFYGYDENGTPLVLAPNNQIVQINVAYNFVVAQIKKQQEKENTSSSKGPEGMPQQPSMPKIENIKSQESRIEQGPSSPEKSPESRSESSQNNIAQPVIAPPKKTTPKVTVVEPELKDIYGDGFKVNLTEKTVKEVIKYIEENAEESNNKSSKWLAVLMDKLIKEMQQE